MKKVIAAFSLTGLLVCLLAGCAGAGGSDGVVSADGSSSMERVMGFLAEGYTETHEGMKVIYNPTGSGSGIKAVSDGRCDIGLSSRALTEEEKQGLTETVVAIDGIAVIVNPENMVSDISVEDLAALYMGKITNWEELGGADAPVVLIGREAASGTRDGFESVTGTEEQCKYSQELTASGDVVQTVAQNPNAIGYTSLAAVKENVKVIRVEGVSPSGAAIQNGSYKPRRDFIFVTKKNAALSENAQDFFDYATSGAADALIEKAGAFPAAR